MMPMSDAKSYTPALIKSRKKSSCNDAPTANSSAYVGLDMLAFFCLLGFALATAACLSFLACLLACLLAAGAAAKSLAKHTPYRPLQMKTKRPARFAENANARPVSQSRKARCPPLSP
uniref:Uncharacterized protein n=1 Tax=Chloropicon laureae TaxID=464258 RepID=A0A7S2Z034_9CHLO